MKLSVVIPTLNRPEVVHETILALLGQTRPPDELIVVDQSTTPTPAAIESELLRIEQDSPLLWLRDLEPSIPKAMNEGARNATGEILLFLDDDIRIEENFLETHYRKHLDWSTPSLLAGQVLQPGEVPSDQSDHRPGQPGFLFRSSRGGPVREFMGGNFSLLRSQLLDLGGFDENFLGVAYHFEREFAHRFRSAGHSIQFVPSASIDHLRHGSGGTREQGSHLSTSRPDHAIGAYYCQWRTLSGGMAFCQSLHRFLRSVRTRHHLRHPWLIPRTLLAELRGARLAFHLHRAGPRLPLARGGREAGRSSRCG